MTTATHIDKKTLIANLNEDLAGELSAIIQYTLYAAKATGPYRPQLVQFFQSEITDEQQHAQFLANKIVTMGGEPTSVPRPVPPATSNRMMLEKVLAAEERAIADYTRRAEEADELGDKGLQVRLEDMIAEESDHFEETKRMLTEWPL